MDTKKIIIIGSGISGLTAANNLLKQGIKKDEILVIEAKERAGGLIRTSNHNGYKCEWGPEGLRGKSENTENLFNLIDVKRVPASDQAKIRYLVHNKKIKKVPLGPISALTTPLIPFFSKLRIFKEPFVKPYYNNESIHDFFERRLGHGVLPLVDAFVSGIYGGDYKDLSIMHTFPKLKEFEQSNGSIIKGQFASMRSKKADSNGKSHEKKEPKEKKPFLYSTEDGMEGIIKALAKNVDIKFNTTILAIDKKDQNYIIHSEDGDYSSKDVIVATGPSGIKNIKINGELLSEDVIESRIKVVALGFDKSAFDKEIKGYGFLSPSNEERNVLGILFTSCLFEEDAPQDKILLRCFVGGIRNPEFMELSNEELRPLVMQDVKDLLYVNSEPEYFEVFTHYPRGIPQLTINHQKILDWKEKIEKNNKNLYLSGVGWTGIACDHLIEEAIKLTNKIIEAN